MNASIKICGIKTAEAMNAASRAGATHIGFNFFMASPRFIAPAHACDLAKLAPNLKSVALSVNADNATLDEIVAQATPEFLQLHGDETLTRVLEVKTRYRLPVIKAISMVDLNDVQRAHDYETVADILLFDAKPDMLPGGNGLTFDWHLLSEQVWTKPWMLSGGLTPTNVAHAIHTTHARGVDVSSGVEKSRGEKSEALIESFIAAAKSAFAESQLK